MATDYEQKYKEALERAKKFEDKYGGDYAGSIFPELAESEDERIRKRLIEYFEGFRMGNAEVKWEGLNVQEVLVWLEKQKECVSNNFDDVWDEEDCEEIIAEGQKLTPRFKELFKEVCHAWYDRGAKLEKQKEQKPVEIHVDNPNIEKFDPDVKITTSDSSADGKELLYVCNKSYDIGFRDGVASVKPAEWSEDEFHKTTKLVYRAIRKVLSSLAVYAEDEALLDSKEETLCYYSQHCAEEILKSLRPSWKPSEKQMSWLLRAEGRLRIEGADILASKLAELYEELKKL